MDDGIYHVGFDEGGGRAAEGIAVLVGGRLNGGDSVCIYRGYYDSEGEALTLEVVRHNADQPTVFGTGLHHFTVRLERDDDPERLLFSGRLGKDPGLNITVEFTWLGVLA